MAIKQGTKFIGASPSVNLTETKSAVINENTEICTIEDIIYASRPYKVYAALLTQSGGDDVMSIGTGDLTIGVTYEIIDNAGSNWDFTNVGAPNNNIGTKFVATGTTPASWGIDGQLDYNTGTPVATVLENTLDFDVTYDYESNGAYVINGDFDSNKTFVLINQTGSVSNQFSTFVELGNVYIRTGLVSGNLNELLYNTPIEIRVYN
jgi:hypothetical protein